MSDAPATKRPVGKIAILLEDTPDNLSVSVTAIIPRDAEIQEPDLRSPSHILARYFIDHFQLISEEAKKHRLALVEGERSEAEQPLIVTGVMQ